MGRLAVLLRASVRGSAMSFLNLRTVGTFVIGIAFLVIANSDILIATDPQHVDQQKTLLRALLHEVGFALLVALIIWIMFEYFSHAASEEKWNDRIEKVAKNVFFGVFKRNFPPELIHEANRLLLEQNFIRGACHFSYTLRDDKFTKDDGSEGQFVRLEAVVRFRVRNISSSRGDCPVGVILPNPVHPGLKDKCCVNRVQIKIRGATTEPPLADAETAFREKLADNKLFDAPFLLKPVTLDPNEEFEVVWDYAMAKEEEDTEIIRCLFPTESIAINVMDRNWDKRYIYARSIHRLSLDDDTSAVAQGTYNFRLDTFVLPHQGFAIWWKKRPPARN